MGLSSRRRGSARICCLIIASLCTWEFWSPRFPGTAMLEPVPYEAPVADVCDLSAFVSSNAWLFAAAACCLCCAVLRTESTTPPPPPSVTVLEKRDDFQRVTIMSAHLSFLSGMVNALCILGVGMTVSHHTGNASHSGRLFGIDALRFECAMTGFFAGAFVAGYNKVDGETLYAGRYSAGLMAASIAVAAAAILQWNSDVRLYSVPLFAFSQGIQNAVSRKHSALPICTTHFTGYLTDFGSLLGGYTRASLTGGAGPSIRRPSFFGLSILTFAIGGFVAKKLLDSMGIVAALVPASLMAVTAMGLVPFEQKIKNGK